jgi:organic radical activating enzyme
MTREITNINYCLTTFCSRSCPDCFMHIPTRKNKYYMTWEEIENSAKYFSGIPRINLSGGEPTFHPHFQEYIPKFKSLFHCKKLSIETNGYGFQKFPDMFLYFDELLISHYTTDSYKDCEPNTEDVNFIKSYLKGSNTNILVGEIVHIDNKHRSRGLICGRGTSETVSFCDGRIYPCCVGPGVEGADSIPLMKNWKEEILKVPLPCKNCIFSLP